MTALVIVESAPKCAKIQSYLGTEYRVMASVGHIRTLNGLTDIDVVNGFRPTYTPMTEKKKVIAKLKEAIKEAREVVLATDDDREGEAIAWHICDMFRLPIHTTKRIVFHEISERAVIEAIRTPRTINMHRVHAQQARQILDVLVGFTISPFVWKRTNNRHLSAGRCQTPALRLVYDNEQERIRKTGLDSIKYQMTAYATDRILPFTASGALESVEIATHFLQACRDNPEWQFTCSIPKSSIRSPPIPFTTSTLQQTASNILHWSPSKTMKCAQELYEQGHITYMRTDSTQLSDDFVQQTIAYVTHIYGSTFVRTSPLTVASQGAHEAIRPVLVSALQPATLTKEQQALYQLIWRRSVAACMSPAQYQTVQAKLSKHVNTATLLDTVFLIHRAEKCVHAGWEVLSASPTDAQDSIFTYLTSLAQPQIMQVNTVMGEPIAAERMLHLTEAGLVQLLEAKGIGRPSTFASLVDKIQTREYVRKENVKGTQIECMSFELRNHIITTTPVIKEIGAEKNKLLIQPLGHLVLEYLVQEFDRFFAYSYTKSMEDQLDQVEQGNIPWVQVCANCYQQLVEQCDLPTQTNKTHTKWQLSLIPPAHDTTGDYVALVGKHGLVVKRTEKMKRTKGKQEASFLPVKKEITLQQLQQSNVEWSVEQICMGVNKQPWGQYQGHDLVLKQGKYGAFVQWGTKTASLSSSGLDESSSFDAVVAWLQEKDTTENKQTTAVVRKISDKVSIRTGKYGDYIYVEPQTQGPSSLKANKTKPKPSFYKLKGCPADYTTCELDILRQWIEATHHITC